MDETTFARIPLADRMRPQTLSEMVGQAHLLSPDAPFRKQIASGQIRSMLFWGPPGSGKTTLALIIAKELGHHFITLSAVFSGVKDIRNAAATAREIWEKEKRKTLLFVDEIHRFSKSQQDAFLPYVEDGTMILIGATTENPSFEVIAPLRSRARVIVLKALSPEDIQSLLRRALDDVSRGMARFKPVVDRQILTYLSEVCDGDARIALNLLEGLVMATPPNEEGERVLDPDAAREAIRRETLLYDKAGEEHYNLISAFHKSLRGSDPDAALYWLARMLASGEDPLYVARRMIRFATEDVGNADPMALLIANQAMESYRFLGSPEGELALAQAALYLASAPKSNAVYKAFGRVNREISKTGARPVPFHLRNAPTRLMKALGYGRDYRYPHDDPDGVVHQTYLPDGLETHTYYDPKGVGYEEKIRKRLARWRALKKSKGKDFS
jgi:putative ATPase